MPGSVDWPRKPSLRYSRAPRQRRPFLLIVAVLAFVVVACWAALSYYVDALWFESIGYGDVFWKTLSVRWVVFTVFAAATFIVLYGLFLALKRAHRNDLPINHTIFIGGQPLKLPVERVLRVIAPAIALLIALATGAGMMAEWPSLALYWYAPRASSGIADPIFGKPLDFYLFTLPAWQLITGWMMMLAVVRVEKVPELILVSACE
jgi:uncharacterized protein